MGGCASQRSSGLAAKGAVLLLILLLFGTTVQGAQRQQIPLLGSRRLLRNVGLTPTAAAADSPMKSTNTRSMQQGAVDMGALLQAISHVGPSGSHSSSWAHEAATLAEADRLSGLGHGNQRELQQWYRLFASQKAFDVSKYTYKGAYSIALLWIALQTGDPFDQTCASLSLIDSYVNLQRVTAGRALEILDTLKSWEMQEFDKFLVKLEKIERNLAQVDTALQGTSSIIPATVKRMWQVAYHTAWKGLIKVVNPASAALHKVVMSAQSASLEDWKETLKNLEHQWQSYSQVLFYLNSLCPIGSAIYKEQTNKEPVFSSFTEEPHAPGEGRRRLRQTSGANATELSVNCDACYADPLTGLIPEPLIAASTDIVKGMHAAGNVTESAKDALEKIEKELRPITDALEQMEKVVTTLVPVLGGFMAAAEPFVNAMQPLSEIGSLIQRVLDFRVKFEVKNHIYVNVKVFGHRIKVRKWIKIPVDLGFSIRNLLNGAKVATEFIGDAMSWCMDQFMSVTRLDKLLNAVEAMMQNALPTLPSVPSLPDIPAQLPSFPELPALPDLSPLMEQAQAVAELWNRTDKALYLGERPGYCYRGYGEEPALGGFEDLSFITSGVRLPACIPGTYGVYDSTTHSGCQNAPKGHHAPGFGSTAPLPCPAGTAQPKEGQASCYKCPPGTFMETPGSPFCYDCPHGYSTNGLDGQTQCTPCPRVQALPDAPGGWPTCAGLDDSNTVQPVSPAPTALPSPPPGGPVEG